MLGVPFVIITVSATLQGFNQNLVRAAASLGASPLTAFRRVTLPLIAPGVISGALFAFATSFDEVVVTLFLAGPEQATLPRQMFSGIRENLSPTIAAAATLLIAFSVILLLTLEWLRGRSEKLRTAQVKTSHRSTVGASTAREASDQSSSNVERSAVFASRLAPQLFCADSRARFIHCLNTSPPQIPSYSCAQLPHP